MFQDTTIATTFPAIINNQSSKSIDESPARSSDNDLFLIAHFFRTLYHFFPSFEQKLENIPDPRQQAKTVYSLPALLKAAMSMFLFKTKSRRYYNDLRSETLGTENLIHWLKTETLPHGDTIQDAIAKMDVSDLELLRTEGIKSLLRSRVLEKFRLLERYYMIAFDGTQIYTFQRRHCEHCLTKTCKKKDGTEYTIYYHTILEAKLLTPNGMAFSIASEFIENDAANPSKQDCELKAFYRLLPRLRQDFPKLPLVLLLDGLFAGSPTFDLCKKHRCHYIITFKGASIPTLESEFQALCSLQPENNLKQSLIRDGKNIEQSFRWVNQIDYQGSSLQILEQLETKKDKSTRFKWITDLKISRNNCSHIANQGGRCRWKIENQGFNIQKNGEFELEHSYSLHDTVWKLFYLLMQITHNWEQCVLHSETFLKVRPPQARTRRGLFERLRGIFLFCSLNWNWIFSFIEKPCQIRWRSN